MKCYNSGETSGRYIRLIIEMTEYLSERKRQMDSGADSYRRFLDSDYEGLAESELMDIIASLIK